MKIDDDDGDDEINKRLGMTDEFHGDVHETPFVCVLSPLKKIAGFVGWVNAAFLFPSVWWNFILVEMESRRLLVESEKGGVFCDRGQRI